MIDIQEYFVVQTQPKGFVNQWEDCDHEWFSEAQEHEAHDWADYLREDKTVEVRVVRRWK